jgi:hypothetical protein
MASQQKQLIAELQGKLSELSMDKEDKEVEQLAKTLEIQNRMLFDRTASIIDGLEEVNRSVKKIKLEVPKPESLKASIEKIISLIGFLKPNSYKPQLEIIAAKLDKAIEAVAGLREIGGKSTAVTDSALLQIADDAKDAIYLGDALPGSLEAEAVWRIQRVREIKNITITEWADGNTKFDNKWVDRADLKYS